MSEKVLIALSWADKIDAAPQAYKMLRDQGYELAFNRTGGNLTEANLIEMLPGVSAAIAGSDKFTANALAAGDQLKVISRVGVGFDAIDVRAASAKGVVVTTSPTQQLFEAMAEETIAMMINVSRQIPYMDRMLKEGKWTRSFAPSVFHRTLGIVGMGRIGKEVVKLARAFQMHVLCYDIYHDEAFATQYGVKYVDLPELLREADYVSIHTPLTEQTHHLMNRDRFRQMKRTACLINTSRGPVVDETALHWALTEKIIAGAASDVFEKEPADPHNPLLKLDNFVGTPHTGGLSTQAIDALFLSAAQSVIDVLQGRQPYLVINPEVFAEQRS
ncbi:MAG: phosphoglycerate dehydrogenase [Chloroflexota bacterium]